MDGHHDGTSPSSTGSCWSLPESKRRNLGLLGRSLTTDMLLKNSAGPKRPSGHADESPGSSTGSECSWKMSSAEINQFVGKYATRSSTCSASLKVTSLGEEPASSLMSKMTLCGDDAPASHEDLHQLSSRQPLFHRRHRNASNDSSGSSLDSLASASAASSRPRHHVPPRSIIVQSSATAGAASAHDCHSKPDLIARRSLHRVPSATSIRTHLTTIGAHVCAAADQKTDHLEEAGCKQVLDFLFVSNLLKAAFDKRLLCKHNVEFLVNVSGLDLDRLPPKLKPSTLVPRCTCQTSDSAVVAHPRAVLDVFPPSMQPSMPVSEQSIVSDLHRCFKSVNAFIAKARAQNKRLLIFDYAADETSANSARCALIVIQYVMFYYKLPYAEARESYGPSQGTAASTAWEPLFDAALKRWEKSVQAHHRSKSQQLPRTRDTSVTKRSRAAEQDSVTGGVKSSLTQKCAAVPKKQMAWV